MLAYLFWHWPAGSDAAGYERALTDFHQQLTATGSEGFHGSTSYRVEGAGWLPEGTGYEDWYLLDGSFALDPLNEVAVSPALRAAHDRSAHAAAGGAGGLYRLLGAHQAPASAQGATWFAKPRGMPYPDFYEQAAHFTGKDGVSFWRRQMVLGPAPEFCLIGDRIPELPPAWQPQVVRRTALTGSGGPPRPIRRRAGARAARPGP